MANEQQQTEGTEQQEAQQGSARDLSLAGFVRRTRAQFHRRAATAVDQGDLRLEARLSGIAQELRNLEAFLQETGQEPGGRAE